ncbi:MAG: hypothetical protein A2X64_03515 [Ignavibacteria bacterium GWF2_33_9]|nr:MAG: hypothetical protein A2X64_03515 [Ignavibacteria bacterium GWF2_33_9]
MYGILKGKVVDEDGKGVLGATVRVMGTTQGAAVRAKDGSFTVVNITSGSYDVSVKAVGKKEVIKKIRISADETTEISVTLTDESVMGETITVVAERAMVSKTDIGKKTSYSSDEVTNTANEGVAALVGLSAGVRSAGAGFNVRGTRTSETQIRVDGLDVGSQFTGGLGWGGTTYLPMVSSFGTEEVQVLTGGFSAEYGQSQGGIVNTVVKTGKTDRYEGYFRYRTDMPSFNGRAASGLEVVKNDTRYEAIQTGEGPKLQGSNENTIEFGIGGPMHLPIFKNSTFFISTLLFNEQYRGNSYEIYDPAGNNLGQIENQGTWKKNITARMRFAISENIGLILGTQYGLTSAEFGSWSWLYATQPGVLNGDTNNIPHNLSELPVGNQLVYNFMARLNHTLNSSSFYEFTVSRNTNNDVQGRRYIDPVTHVQNISGPDFFNGFKILDPRDNYVISNGELIAAPYQDGKKIGDFVIDEYTNLTKEGKSADGYLTGDIPVRNNLTGYFEGASYGGTSNAYGIQGPFASAGSGSSINNRLGTYWQFDGNYTNAFSVGEFSHITKAGFEYRAYELHKHSNGNPYDGNPFYDIYTDLNGGNIYTADDKVWELTSKPRTPITFAAYVQDQISYKGIVISPGLRMDIMNPNSTYRLTQSTFIPISSDTGFTESKTKFQISPRINVSYPITELSVLSLSYGLYFKTPQFQNLYDNFNVDILRGNSILGNPDMEAQRTNSYQIAYNQQLNDYLALGITAYYNDQYNQLGLSYVPTVPTPFYEYTVTEYGNTRGVEFELRKRPFGDHINLVLNYTFAKADGTSPDAASNYSVVKDIYSEKLAFPLSAYPMQLDVRHYFKGYLTLFWGNNEGPTIFNYNILENTDLSFSGFYRTGYPYTKTDLNGVLLGEFNTERYPDYWTMDARLSRTILLKEIFGEGIGNTAIELFVDVYNVFNLTPVLQVYSATGDPINNGKTLEKRAGDFSSTTWYKDATYENPVTFNSSQYDLYGNRFYNAASDFNNDGMVTQQEKLDTYMNYAKTSMSFLGNFAQPRTIYAGVMIRFN